MSRDLEFESRIHERLLKRDVTASEELARHYLPLVRRHVEARARKHGVFDDDLINDASVDAVFGYIRNPAKFDPTLSGLLGYLKRAAECDLINGVEKDRRRRRGEELSEDVELTASRGNKSSVVENVRRDAEAEILQRLEPPKDISDVLDRFENSRDKELLRLMANGERKTAVFAAVLHISELAESEQRLIVKQHKDRIKKRLHRAGGERA